MLQIEDKNGVLLAYLNNASQGEMTEEMNGVYSLNFVTVIDHLKTDYLYDKENIINCNGVLFYVTEIEELHDSDDSVTVAVRCEHESYKLIKNEFEKFNHVDITPREAVRLAIAGTPFELGVCEVTEPITIQSDSKCNGKQILMEVIELTKGELQYVGRTINIFKRRGTDRGTGFIFKKNLSSVKRIVNMIDDKITYDVSVVEAPELNQLGYYEVGDTVRIMDERLNVDIPMRILSVQKDVTNGINNRVELGDKVDDIQNSFDRIEQEIIKVDETIQKNATDWDKIKDITDSAGNIVIGKLNSLTDIANKIVNSTGTFEHRDNALYWQDQPTMEASTFATLWSAQGIVFANSKTPDGEWIWQSALDAEGLTANKVTAKALYGMLIEAADIVASNITGGKITGVTIDGKSILAGDIKMTGNITWDQKNSPVKVQYSIDGENDWHTNPTVNDKYASYSYDGGQTWTQAIRIAATDGLPGTNGVDGRTTYLHIKYSNVANPTSSNQMNETGGDYIGQYTDFVQADSDDPKRYTWTRIKGDTGEQGVPGTDGENGKTTYFHVKYSPVPMPISEQMTETPNKYIGTYVDYTQHDSTDPQRYAWSRFEGMPGADGIPGKNGSNGQTSYLHIKYSDVANPTSASQMNDTGGIYLGQYTDFIKADSDDPKKYTWTKIKGDNGQNGSDGRPGMDGKPGINGITYYTWYAYADNINGDGFSFIPEGKTYMGIRYNELSSTPSSNQYDYTWFRFRGIDGQNGSNGADGKPGPPGPQGPPGSDANVPSYIKSTYIDSVTIKAPRIEGNVVNAGVLQGGYIRGTTIEGSTVYGGDVGGVHARLSPDSPLAVYRPTGKVAELWGAIDGSSYMNLYDRNGSPKVSISSGANSASTSQFTDTGSMDIRIDGVLNLTGQSGFNIYAWNRTSSAYMELYRSYMSVGNPFIETYIDGKQVIISNLTSKTISELEVQNMELMTENKQTALKQSELEVLLMERGVL